MTPTIHETSTAIVKGFVSLTPQDQRLAQVVYRLLATGEPAPLDTIAAEAGWTVGNVEERIDAWPAVVRDDSHAIVGFWGLTTKPVSSHQVAFDGLGTAWAWCALDTLFIPQLLGVVARVDSSCPTTGEDMRLTVSPGGPRDLEPSSAVMSMLTPDTPFDDDVRQTVCHYIHLFVSPGAAQEWTDLNPGTFSLPVEDAFEIAVRFNAGVFPALVGPEASR